MWVLEQVADIAIKELAGFGLDCLSLSLVLCAYYLVALFWKGLRRMMELLYNSCRGLFP